MVYFKRAEFWHRTGSAIGEPEQNSPPEHPFRQACAPERTHARGEFDDAGAEATAAAVAALRSASG